MMIETFKLIDRKVFFFINEFHSPRFDDLMFYISAIWVFVPFFVYWLYLVYNTIGGKKTVILIGFFGLLIALTDQSSNQIKHTVKRMRPTHNLEIKDKVHTVNNYVGGKYGFFSGHSANSFGIAMLLFLLFSKQNLLFRYSFFLWAALTAYSRIYLGVHYPSDIFVGMVVGLFWGVIVYKLIEFTFKKYFNEVVAI